MLSLIAAAYVYIKVASLYKESVVFFKDNIETVEFSNGRIINMPITHKTIDFRDWTIHIDKKYISKDSLNNEISSDTSLSIFIGPETAYIILMGKKTAIDYPDSFSGVVDIEKIHSYWSYISGGLIISTVVGFFIYKFAVGLFYILVIIAPIIIFKFRRMGLAYSGCFKAGLYLVFFQLIVSTVLFIAKIYILWDILLYILFYIFYIGAFVNIDISKGLSKIKKG